MYVLERRVPNGTGKCSQCHWEQYAECGRRAPLERVRLGLGGTKEWRVRKIAAVGRIGHHAA